MFDRWPDQFSPSQRRVVDPPRPVIVDVASAIPTRPLQFGFRGVLMRIRMGGLRLDYRTPGMLHAWAQVYDGSWLGLCTFTLETGNGIGQLPVKQWCPGHAIAPLSAIGNDECQPAEHSHDHADHRDQQ